MQSSDVWTYRDQSHLGYDATSGRDLSGYGVEALDGSIGKFDEAQREVPAMNGAFRPVLRES